MLGGRGTGACRAVGLLASLVVASGPALAAGAEAGGEGGELLDVSGVAALAVLLGGTLLLVASVELLVHAIVQTSQRFPVSPFALAVVVAGFEIDNVAFGLANGFRELQNVSFGLVVGNAISVFGLVLAIGALTYPFEVDVPADYLALTALAPFVLLPFILFGTFTPAAGVLLLALGVVVFGYIYWQERSRPRSFVQSAEVREALVRADGEAASADLPGPLRPLADRNWFWLVAMVVALGGIAVGAEGSSAGVEGVIETWELSGTFVGVTLVTLLYTADDLLLLVEPLRMGQYDVAVGGVVGSLLFFVTANVGVVALVGTVHVQPSTLYLHFPALVGFTALSVYFLRKGRLDRRHGVALLGFYVAYLLVNVAAFSTLPVGE